jgi:hypothetical protein
MRRRLRAAAAPHCDALSGCRCAAIAVRLGYVSLIGARLVMPTSLLTAPLGVRLAHAMTKRALEIAFGCSLYRWRPVRDQFALVKNSGESSAGYVQGTMLVALKSGEISLMLPGGDEVWDSPNDNMPINSTGWNF